MCSVPVDTELYNLLGVSPNATEGEIRKAYMKKAKEHHPDKNINDPEASKKFQEMAAAYEILSDSQSREIYDMHGMDGLKGNSGGPSMDAADLFAQFFTADMFGFDGPAFRGARGRKGDDSVIEYEVTLEDLYNGKKVKMNMEKEVVCGVCKGTGARGHAKAKACSTCEGKGWKFVQTQIMPAQFGVSRVKCHDCQGSGEKLKEKDRCKKCKGTKTVSEKDRRELYIEKGMTHGQRIVLSGAGDQTPGMPPGDVVFVLKASPHSTFERSASDLLTRITITLSEALFGFSRVLLTHLDGRGIKVSSPSGKIIKPDQCIVLRGEGMPIYKRPDEKGDLYIILNIEMPDAQWLNTVDRAALAALLPTKREDTAGNHAIVDDANFEESDIVDFGGGNDDDWVDEDDNDDDDSDDFNSQGPECQTQ